MTTQICWLLGIISMLGSIGVLFFKKEDDGSYFPEKATRNIEWLGFLVVILFITSYVFVIMSMLNYIHSGYAPESMFWPGFLIWLGLSLFLLIYPPLKLLRTRLTGLKLDMLDHLHNRKEVLFPWEFNPVASGLGLVYYVCSLISVAIGAYYLALYYALPFPRDRIVVALVIFFGAFIGWRVFRHKPDTGR